MQRGWPELKILKGGFTGEEGEGTRGKMVIFEMPLVV